MAKVLVRVAARQLQQLTKVEVPLSLSVTQTLPSPIRVKDQSYRVNVLLPDPNYQKSQRKARGRKKNECATESPNIFVIKKISKKKDVARQEGLSLLDHIRSWFT